MEEVYFLNKEPTALRPAGGIIKAGRYLDLVRADEILARADDKAEQIVARAREQAEEIVAAARETYEQEKERGYRDGLAKGQAEIAGRITETASEAFAFLDKMGAKMVELTMRMLKTILGEMDHRELVEKIVFKTIKGVRDEGRITLRVHPECVDHVKEKIALYAAEAGQEGLFEVIAETRLDKDGCILESEIGYVDSSIGTQLKAIRESLENSVKKHQSTNIQD